jgi:small subunit ribosomal protein S7
MRKTKPKKRIILPDPKFGDVMVTKFVNNLMFDGKKGTAFELFYDAMELVSKRVQEESPVNVWKKALENVTPAVEVRSRRVGGATFQIPQEIRPKRQINGNKIGQRNRCSF